MTRSLPLVTLALALAVIATEARVVVGGKTWDDATYQTEIVPPRLAAARSAHGGVVPAWWDGAGLGVPLAAEPSHGAATPMMWVAASPRALDLVMILHALWLAVGVAIWARHRGSSDLGALTMGVLIATTGLVTSAALRGALPALAHLPWIGWCAQRLAVAEHRRGAARDATILGALIALVGIAGQFAVLLDALAITFVLGFARRTWRYTALATAGGLALACAQWIPAFAIHTAGAELTGLSPARLLELVVPGSFGSRDPVYAIPALASGGWPSLFCGATLLGFAFVPKVKTRRGSALVLGLFVAAMVVGRGGWPAWCGAPELHLAALVILLAVRGAAGVESFVAAERRALVVLVIAAGVAAVVTWAMVALRDTAAGGEVLDRVIWRAVIDGGTGVALLLGAIAIAKLAPKLRFLALALAVAPNLGALHVTAPVMDQLDPPRWASLITGPEPHRLYRNATLDRAGEPSARAAIDTLAGEAPARWGAAAVRTDDPARSPHDDAAWQASAHGGGELLERFGITFAILPASVASAQHLEELDRRALWSLARYPAAPPASVMTDWLWIADPVAALARLFPTAGGRGIAAGSVILQGSGAPPAEQLGHASTCDLVSWEAGAIDLACNAPAQGYAVVSSSAAPGWTVEVDGVRQPWFTADVLRRAVAIPRGRHAVRWRYVVPGKRAAQALALLGLAILAMLGMMATRRRER